MRFITLTAAACIFLWGTAAQAALLRSAAPEVSGFELAQYSKAASREFTRCMRAKYGPRYYRGVKRAHRYIMAQTCGG